MTATRLITFDATTNKSNIFRDGDKNLLYFKKLATAYIDEDTTGLYSAENDDIPVKTFELEWDAQRFADTWLCPMAMS